MNTTIEFLNVNASPRELQEYMERFELWWLTKDDLREDLKSAHFLTVIGREAYTLLKNLAYPQLPSKLSNDKLRDLLLSHLLPENFVVAERVKFNLLIRQPNQSIRDFILQLQSQASSCAFGDKLDECLRDRLIAGINNPDLYRQLLSLPSPTYNHVKSICLHYQDVSDITRSQTTVDHQVLFGSASRRVHAEKRKPWQINSFKPHGISLSHAPRNSDSLKCGQADRKIGQCVSCGKLHSRYTCPHRNSKCHHCGNVGHIRSVCRQFRRCNVVKQVDDSTENLPDDFHSLTLAVNTSGHLYNTLRFGNGMSHRFIVDTGSVESLISKTSLDHLYPDAQLDSTLITIKGITGHNIPVIGCCTLPVLDKQLKSVECKFVVIRQGPSILGLKVMQALKISVNFLSHTDTETQILDLVHDCSVTSGGMRIPPVKLEVAGDPVFCKRRVLPFGLREPVRKVLMSLCESGILVPVQSSRWATPIVTPLKPDGQTPTVCGDYHVTLNTKLLQLSCVTEEPASILSRLHGSKIFSKLYLKDAYLQIPLTDESSELTTINTPFGLYRYRFLPFGLNVSPAIFQDVMNSIVKDLKGVEVYQDDVFVHAVNKPTHDYRVLALLTRFKDADVNINPKKCLIGVHEISRLGYQVTSEGFKPDLDRIKPLVDVKSPTNVHELRSLMGALQYYSKFIPGFASIADPLFTLLNDESFVWLDRHEHVLR
ncbi:unnamed protein product [Dicrocoelium dendriticum]|nr:unnamed protein product [Dicrocoelium dendriticum]